MAAVATPADAEADALSAVEVRAGAEAAASAEVKAAVPQAWAETCSEPATAAAEAVASEAWDEAAEAAEPEADAGVEITAAAAASVVPQAWAEVAEVAKHESGVEAQATMVQAGLAPAEAWAEAAEAAKPEADTESEAAAWAQACLAPPQARAEATEEATCEADTGAEVTTAQACAETMAAATPEADAGAEITIAKTTSAVPQVWAEVAEEAKLDADAMAASAAPQADAATTVQPQGRGAEGLLRLQIVGGADGERRVDVRVHPGMTIVDLKAEQFGSELAGGWRLRCFHLGRMLGDEHLLADLPEGTFLQCYLQQAHGTAPTEEDPLTGWVRLFGGHSRTPPPCSKWQDLAFHSGFAVVLALAWSAYIRDPAVFDAFSRFSLRFFSLAWVLVCSCDAMRVQRLEAESQQTQPARADASDELGEGPHWMAG